MGNRKRLISICVPVYNEERNIRPVYDALSTTLAEVSDRYDFEFVFTDNHSSDGTFEALAELAKVDPRVRAIRFSRNFGFQRSILTAYNNARGDAAVQIDCDLQDPPSLILEFLRKWESGYQVVYGVRTARKEGWGMNTTIRCLTMQVTFALSIAGFWTNC
jgi:glycosyltransferase involved in cell wall biosynthesis